MQRLINNLNESMESTKTKNSYILKKLEIQDEAIRAVAKKQSQDTHDVKILLATIVRQLGGHDSIKESLDAVMQEEEVKIDSEDKTKRARDNDIYGAGSYKQISRSEGFNLPLGVTE